MKPIEVKTGSVPPCVTKRNEFTPFELHIDTLFERVRIHKEDNIFSEEQLRNLLRAYQQLILQECEVAFTRATERAIEQARTLLEDPDYYQTAKERRSRIRERQKEYHLEQERERLEQDEDPEYRARRLANLHRCVDNAKTHYEEAKITLSEAIERYKLKPKLTRMPAAVCEEQ